MILGRPLTQEERRRSQRNFYLFGLVNGASYMCLGETVLILFATQLGAPNAVVSLLGAMLYIGFSLLPLGVRRTARRGAAASQADFWVARNLAALFTACAAPLSRVSQPAAWCVVLLGAFLFYGYRAAGAVMCTPLVGDISSQEEAPGVIGGNAALFNLSAVLMLVAITAATARWHGMGVLVAVIVVGSCFGIASSFFLRNIRETGDIRAAARVPLLPGMRRALANPDLRRLAQGWFLLSLCTMLLIPLSMLALKRGCGFSDSRALVCACAQFLACCLTAFTSGRLCRRFGPRRILVAVAVANFAVPAVWLAMPAGGPHALAAGCALFFLLGVVYTLFTNGTGSYFLLACPDKSEQVAGSVGLNLVSSAAAGVLGSALGPWLITRSAGWAARSGLPALGGTIGPFRLYFLLLLPLLAVTLLATLRLRTKVYDYRASHGDRALRRAIALGHHRKH